MRYVWETWANSGLRIVSYRYTGKYRLSGFFTCSRNKHKPAADDGSVEPAVRFLDSGVADVADAEPGIEIEVFIDSYVCPEEEIIGEIETVRLPF